MADIIHPDTNKVTPPNNAADLIRQKIQTLHNVEPEAKVELKEVQNISGHRSEHQKFMFELGNSGRSLAEIQTAWHNYYVGLPDADKHRVWQEFYDEHNRSKQAKPQQTEHQSPHDTTAKHRTKNTRTVSDLKKNIARKVSNRTYAKKSSHLKSLVFGLSSGFIVVAILLFGFFNERFIAPFISPSKTTSNSSIIIDPTNSDVGPEPKIIIPKINVEIPVIFDEPSVDEDAIQKALEKGVVYYATTSKPGELGNGAIFGHSSNNILNRGNYKYAFVLLNLLKPGDTFYVQKDSVRYVYKVFEKKIVKPTDIGVLEDTGGKEATYSLITCDPPGSAVNRLVVLGEQISPDPSVNTASTAVDDTELPGILPSNSESLWHRMTSWLSS